jgi:hypothetical protein
MKDEEVIEIPCIQFQELNKMKIRPMNHDKCLGDAPSSSSDV